MVQEKISPTLRIGKTKKKTNAIALRKKERKKERKIVFFFFPFAGNITTSFKCV